MQDLENNHTIRFINVSKKKEGMFANFKAKGFRGGVVFTASIAVDLSYIEVDPGDPLENIIEESARVAEKEFKHSAFRFEGLVAI